MRGVASFGTLWRRRTTVELPDGSTFDLLSLPDLVRAKKTQRDKDWPMIRRLLEADFFQRRENATPADIRFWFTELRTPDLLIALARAYPSEARRLAAKRSVASFRALSKAPSGISQGSDAGRGILVDLLTVCLVHLPQLGNVVARVLQRVTPQVLVKPRTEVRQP